jgi:transcriptional regulator with XRE-family HTH domain
VNDTDAPGQEPSEHNLDDVGTAGSPWTAFGDYVRAQRQLAHLSLRQLAAMTRVSNPYLSQVERGLHQPSVAVIKALAEALNLSVEALLAQAAGLDLTRPDEIDTEAVIRTDPRLTSPQKEALLAVYRAMVEESPSGRQGPAKAARKKGSS